MPVDENLANRVRRRIGTRADIAERKMFGCLGFFLNGNLACGVHEQELIIRLGSDAADAALQEPHTRRFDVSGRPMKGWLLVQVSDEKVLTSWLKRAIKYAETLPKK
jgi:TfoX/Sxy family transcriptional regulator of competence genes